MKPDIFLFFGKTNPEFSNFYIAPFEIGGKTYPSVEHYFMYQKAKLFDPEGDAIHKMGNDLTPSQMKKLGRQVKNFREEDWLWASKRYMYEALYAKFTQNADLKEKLMQTGYSILAEASPFDRIWGIGMGVSNANVKDPAMWRGKNWLGLLLMAVRGVLRYGTEDIRKRCGPGRGHIYYLSDVWDVDDVLYEISDENDCVPTPDWNEILRSYGSDVLEGYYSGIADLDRHIAYSTLFNSGILDINPDEDEKEDE